MADKPKFDPNKPFTVASNDVAQLRTPEINQKPKFDPNKPFEPEEAPVQADGGYLKDAEAALQGFGQAATFGYLPQLQAAASKGIEYLRGDEPSDYVKTRDEFIKRDQSLAENSPKSYLAGQVGGAVATPGMGVGKAATTAGKIGKAALAGAATGALYNPGDVEGELSGLQLKDRGVNAVKGGTMSGAAQTAGSAVEKGLSAWANKGKGLEKASNTLALTAAGAKTGELKKLYDKNAMERVGKFLKDENLVGPGKTIEQTLDGASKIADEAGAEIAEIYKKAGSQTLAPTKIAEELDQVFSKELKGKAGGRQILSRIQSELENLKDLGPEAGVGEVLQFRRGIDDLINYDKSVADMPGAQQALKRMRDFLKDKLEGEVSKVDPADLERLKALNKRYWAASEAESIGKRAFAREESKMILGLPELIVGGAYGGANAVNSAVSGQPEDMLTSAGKGLLAAGGMKAARTYGPGLLVKGAAVGGRLLQKDPTAMLARPISKGIGLIPEGMIGAGVPRLGGSSRLKEKEKVKSSSGLMGSNE